MKLSYASILLLVWAGVCWIIGWFLSWVGLGIIDEFLFWPVWLITKIHQGLERLGNPRIPFVVAISFILGSIPFIDWIPWDVISTYIIETRLQKKA